MSKRSHKKREERIKRTKPAQRAAASAAVSQAKSEEPDPSAFEVPDELLTVPKETSRMRFVMMILLIVFLLLVFTIPGALLGGSGGGSSQGEKYLSWTTPGGTSHELSAGEFNAQMRLFHNAYAILPFAGMSLGVSGLQPTQRELARILVLESMAEEAGIEVTVPELGQHIRETIEMYRMTPEVYKQRVQQFGTESVEGTARRSLRAARFLQMVGQAGALPDPAEIDELWNQDHEELAFGYISLSVEDKNEAARAELPDDAALEAWHAEQPENVQDELKTPEKRKAEFVYFTSLEETPGTALLTEFPDTTERTPEEAGEEYYNRVYFTRFARPEEELPEGEVQTADTRYYSQEEKQEQTVQEAPLYFAMQTWLADLQQRQAAGEEIDLKADAERLGLGYAVVDSGTREEFAEEEFFTGDESTDTMLNYAFQAAEGGFGWSIATSKNRLVITRTTEIAERALPEFAEIKEQVAEKWIEPRALELATAELQGIWESFPELTREPEEGQPAPEGPFHQASTEQFEGAANDAGLTYGTRDYVDKGGQVNDDPNWEEAPNKFIATHREYFTMDVDEVGAPQAARDNTAVYLVRMAGKRPVPLDDMQPTQYESYKTRARSAALNEISEALDYETLVAECDLWLLADEWEAEDEAADDTAPAGAN